LIIQSISLSAIVGREIGNQGYKTWNCGKRKAKSMSLIALVMTFFSKERWCRGIPLVEYRRKVSGCGAISALNGV
jgi:hypothetical protein